MKAGETIQARLERVAIYAQSGTCSSPKVTEKRISVHEVWGNNCYLVKIGARFGKMYWSDNAGTWVIFIGNDGKRPVKYHMVSE